MYQALLDKITHRQATVGLIGLGYVGLPLSICFAQSGFKVIGLDTNPNIVDNLNQAKSHIQDVPNSDLSPLLASDRFQATTDSSRLKECDVILIAVPTPLVKTRDPDLTFVQAACQVVAECAHKGQLVILESTTYPGTTRELLVPAMASSGLHVGTDAFVAFSPERVDPGNPRFNTKNTPKIVGGITPNCTALATALYASCINTIVPVSSPEAAELSKLLENTFRTVNIALANEMALVCDRLGLDVWEVIDAAATKPFGFMKFTPGPGIGGHCIPLDPHYLSWKMRTLNYKTRFIDLASEINSQMPAHVLVKIAEGLNEDKKAINGSRVLVLGLAYKPDINDIRESPALDIIHLLETSGAEVNYHDPFIPTWQDGEHMHESAELNAYELSRVDAVVIVTNHSNIDYQFLADNSGLIIDTRNALHGITGSARVVSLGIGPLAKHPLT